VQEENEKAHIAAQKFGHLTIRPFYKDDVAADSVNYVVLTPQASIEYLYVHVRKVPRTDDYIFSGCDAVDCVQQMYEDGSAVEKLKLPRPVAIKILRELLQTGLINFFARTSDREIELPSDFYDSSRVFYTFAFDSPFAAASTPVSEKSETVVQTVTTVTKSVVFKPSHSNVISRMREDGSLNDMFLSALSSGESEAYRSRSQSFQVQSGRRITLDSSAIRERRSSFNGDVPRR